MGIGSLHVGSTRALAIREDPSHFFNRAGGFGSDSPIAIDDLVPVCDFYREQGVAQGSFMIDTVPTTTTTDRAALEPG